MYHNAGSIGGEFNFSFSGAGCEDVLFRVMFPWCILSEKSLRVETSFHIDKPRLLPLDRRLALPEMQEQEEQAIKPI